MQTTHGHRWSVERAAAWRERVGWLVGANYNPRTASNQLEMWQADTFDPDTIEQELKWSADLGFNCHRVYLHDLLWTDAAGFCDRFDRFLAICDATGHRVMPVLFDDCWKAEPELGPQPEPMPGVHNSQWVQSPSVSVKERWNDDDRARLRVYVQGVLERYRDHPTIVMWDLYNEPGSRMYLDGDADPTAGFASLPVLEDVFRWAREVDPSQPLTVGVHDRSAAFDAINPRQRELSDVLTFHHYGPPSELPEVLAWARGGEVPERPMVCTEYMARGWGSTFASHLPELKAQGIGAIHWGLVDGRSQTKFPWGSPEGAGEPDPWHHEVLQANGTAYRPDEAQLIRSVTREDG